MSSKSLIDSDDDSDEDTFPESHGNFFIEKIRNLRTNSPEILPDLSLICKGGNVVLAHKFVLQFVSKYFQVKVCKLLNFINLSVVAVFNNQLCN